MQLNLANNMWVSLGDYILFTVWKLPYELMIVQSEENPAEGMGNSINKEVNGINYEGLLMSMNSEENRSHRVGNKIIASSRSLEDREKFLSTLSPVFQPCTFPYQVENGGQHYTLWFPSLLQEVNELEINRLIEENIKQLIAFRDQHIDSTSNESASEIKNIETEFDYAWYINPKMTVPEFFHVQVFFVIFEK